MTPGILILLLLIIFYIGWTIYLSVRFARNTNWATGVLISIVGFCLTPLFLWICCEATDYGKDTYFYYK